FSEDDKVGAAPVIVASYAFAQKHFGGATSALGQTLTLNDVPFTVAGVTPPEFFGVDPSQAPGMYVPMHNNLLLGANDPYPFTDKDYLDNNYYWMQAMARLRPGVTLAQAQAELAPKFHQWVETTAANDKERATLPDIVLREGRGGIDSLRREYSKPLFLLMTLVGLILVISCSNVANLLLARAASRRREIAVRLSEGASRARVVRQLLTESILLGAMGGTLGVLLAFWGIRLLSALLAAHSDEGAMLHAQMNWHVLAVAAGLSVLTGLIFGLIPALQSTRMDLVSALKETQTRQSNAKPTGWRVSMSQILVVGQIATTMLMLVAAGLFVRTLRTCNRSISDSIARTFYCSRSTPPRLDIKTRKFQNSTAEFWISLRPCPVFAVRVSLAARSLTARTRCRSAQSAASQVRRRGICRSGRIS
ncbi:MAG TPA: FtsX-like permease family protein, partial [Candidatus Sulfotelmatobacter sp.]|nr:FtsX-like permease family protein [Candidatus Sulfotelmatobacter sp.]